MKFEVRAKPKAASPPHQVKKPSGVQSAFVKAAKAHLKQTREVRDDVAQGAAPGYRATVKMLDLHIAKVAERIQRDKHAA